jgi:hypothetical protein
MCRYPTHGLKSPLRSDGRHTLYSEVADHENYPLTRSHYTPSTIAKRGFSSAWPYLYNHGGTRDQKNKRKTNLRRICSKGTVKKLSSTRRYLNHGTIFPCLQCSRPSCVIVDLTINSNHSTRRDSSNYFVPLASLLAFINDIFGVIRFIHHVRTCGSI